MIRPIEEFHVYEILENQNKYQKFVYEIERSK